MLKELKKQGASDEQAVGKLEEKIRLAFSGRYDLESIKDKTAQKLLNLLGRGEIEQRFTSPVLLGSILYNRLKGNKKENKTIEASLYKPKLNSTQMRVLATMETIIRKDTQSRES